MIIKMSDEEDVTNVNKSVNGLSQSNTSPNYNQGDLGLDETLSALLASSLLATDAENLNDLDDIAGEYSALNNTIDEINRYLDRWDERHNQLRAHIREALQESDEERNQEQSEDDSKSNSDTGTDSGHSSNEIGTEKVDKPLDSVSEHKDIQE